MSADPPPARIKQSDNIFLTLTVENDLFVSPDRDGNYTSGVRLTYFNADADPPGAVRALGDALPFFDVNETTRIYYAAGQNLYTPEVIATAVPDPDDRPYAAFLYGTIGYSRLSTDRVDEVELTLGVVGPAALGEQSQKFVHDLLNVADPRGWDSQLHNEPALILAWQRRWPQAWATDLGSFYFRAVPHAGVTLGNVYTHAAGGVMLQLVPQRHSWRPPPARVQPAISGPGYFPVSQEILSWSFYTGFEGRAVARDIFLDGNTFKDSPSVARKKAVWDINTGFTITIRRIQILYTLNWRSDEFSGQRKNALFGSVSLGYRF